MKKPITWSLWAVMYILCVWLGLLSQPQNGWKFLYTLIAIAFFVPGGLLLYWGICEKNRRLIRSIRIIAIVSLSLTLLLLVANFCSVLLSEQVANVLHVFLVVVSAPMVCSQYWVASLFLWACLFMGSLLKWKPTQK